MTINSDLRGHLALLQYPFWREPFFICGCSSVCNSVFWVHVCQCANANVQYECEYECEHGLLAARRAAVPPATRARARVRARTSSMTSIAAVTIAANLPASPSLPTHNCKTRLHTHDISISISSSLQPPHPTVVMPSCCCCTLLAMLAMMMDNDDEAGCSASLPSIGVQGSRGSLPVSDFHSFHSFHVQPGRRMLLASLQISPSASEK